MKKCNCFAKNYFEITFYITALIKYCSGIHERSFYYDWIVMEGNKTLSNLGSMNPSLVIDKRTTTTRDRVRFHLHMYAICINSN